MQLRKIEIVAYLAHFKKPFAKKQQFTYNVPPISTVIGIMQNLFNDNVNNFIFGYIFKHDGVFKDVQRIWKEINVNVRKENDKARWNTDIAEVHYLINCKLVIYTDIEKEIVLNECLNLGKTDCLAKVIRDEWIELNSNKGKGYNQWTDININGDGFPERVATETKYNGKKGYYDIYTKLLKLNNEFECENYYDAEEEQNIFLWNWKSGGEINEFK